MSSAGGRSVTAREARGTAWNSNLRLVAAPTHLSPVGKPFIQSNSALISAITIGDSWTDRPPVGRVFVAEAATCCTPWVRLTVHPSLLRMRFILTFTNISELSYRFVTR